MSATGSRVSLVDVDEPILERLISAAVADASVNEVTAPISVGNDWSPPRIEWLREFHRTRRDGLNGRRREATWAIVVGAEVVGSVRLRQTAETGILEAGIWLTRRVRGHGVARAAMADLLQKAVMLGARAVRAETTADNAPALGLLEQFGFELARNNEGTIITAVLAFDTP